MYYQMVNLGIYPYIFPDPLAYVCIHIHAQKCMFYQNEIVQYMLVFNQLVL